MNFLKRKLSPKTLIRGLFFDLIRHIYLLIKSSEYRKSSYYYSLSNRLPRYQPISIKLNNLELTAPDAASFASMYEEIYVDRIYETSESIGRVLDLGSNIGISVLWFQEFYPESEVVAYEADRDIFKYLENNTKNCKGVSIINEAVWHRDEILQFNPEGADAGRISDDQGTEKSVAVQAKDIRKILDEKGPFDYIKMDIEGAESEVIPACRGFLNDTKYIFCEYHSTFESRQSLSKILGVLYDEGFRVHIKSIATSKQPFVKIYESIAGYDMQLNIFAWKG